MGQVEQGAQVVVVAGKEAEREMGTEGGSLHLLPSVLYYRRSSVVPHFTGFIDLVPSSG